MKPHYVAFACLLLGCQNRTAVGVVIDSMTDQPIAGLRIMARATAQADMTCRVLESTTDAEGHFLLKGACRDVPYDLESGDKTIFLAGSPNFVGGVPSEDQLNLNAWRAPPGDGVYVLKGDEIFAMRVASRVAELPLWKSPKEKVLYPETIPAKLPVVGAADHLIISGHKNVKRLELLPLIKHDEALRFGSKNHYFDMDPWSYIGRRFQSRDSHEAVTAQLDETNVVKLIESSRALIYIPGNALPNGVYALMGPGDKRLYLLEIKR